MAKQYTAKQIAAGFGGKKAQARRRSSRRMTSYDAGTGRARYAPARRRASSGRPRGKSHQPMLRVGKLLPSLYVLLPTFFGGMGAEGVVPALKRGDWKKAMNELIDVPAKQMLGTTVTHNFGEMDLQRPLTFGLLYIGGRFMSKVATRSGVNATLKAVQKRTVGGRPFILI